MSTPDAAPNTEANPYAPPAVDVGYGEPAVQGTGDARSVPPPPDLHWLLVVLLSVFSFSIFYYVWIFRQAAWVKRIDPTSQVIPLQIGFIVLIIVGSVMSGGKGESATATDAIGLLLTVASWVMVIWANFSVRRSMLNYFNGAVPIGLRMSGVMTFFFHTLYFQHHMSRIDAWKKTGVLKPQ